MTVRILLVTDPSYGDDAIVRCVEAIAPALPAGAFCVQLRDKRRPLPSLRMFAWRLRVITRKVGARFVVNGNPRVARDAGADGVHLGSDSGGVREARLFVGRRTWVSVAAHSDEDVRRAVADGADAVLVSPIFSTRSPSFPPCGTEKEGRGLEALRRARTLAGRSVAVFALGGVTPERTRGCAAAGADGVAVMKALLACPAPAPIAAAFHGALVSRW
jgi:thiamine-phosphate diphosphorylase